MTVSKYRRRPTVVEALRWHGWPDSSQQGDSVDTEVEIFVGQHNVDAKAGQLRIWVEKSRAWCAVDLGDYIIREPDGVGFYPCKAEVFETSYEHLPEPPRHHFRPWSTTFERPPSGVKDPCGDCGKAKSEHGGRDEGSR